MLFLNKHPGKILNPDSFSEDFFSALKKEFGNNKQYPRQYEKQILIALSYFPELWNVPIKFRLKRTFSPLATRPAWTSTLRQKGMRKFIVTISDSSMSKLSPILFKNLDFNAQVGVIGHELSHASDFSTRSSVGLLRISIGHLSSRYIDKFEYRTDSICIAHGLGYQLLAWSSFVRKAFHQQNWDGANYINEPMKRERYMNPSTIKKRISLSVLYKEAAK